MISPAEDEFTALREQKRGSANPAMVGLLHEVAAGKPIRVSLVEGQSARGLRVAISRAATSRGLRVETVEGDGFVAVRKVDQLRTRTGAQSSSEPGKRRGRPPTTRQAPDQAEMSSFEDQATDLATGES